MYVQGLFNSLFIVPTDMILVTDSEHWQVIVNHALAQGQPSRYQLAELVNGPN